MTIQEFIKENNLELDVLPAHENPYRIPQDQMNAVHWSCQLVNSDNRSFIAYFSKGPGLRVWIDGTVHGDRTPFSKVGTPYDGPMPPLEDEADQLKFLKQSTPERPSFEEVLTCLIRDIRNAEACLGFDDWCALFNRSVDSCHAKKCYDGVHDQAIRLRALLGLQEYEYLLLHKTPRQ